MDPIPFKAPTATIDRLQRQLALADITGEAIIQDRDRLQRELAAMTKERDVALAALSRPVYQLLEELGDLTAKLEHERRQVRGMRMSIEDARDLREQLVIAKTELQEAQARVVELAVGLEPESQVLREKSARTRAIEAAANAEFAMAVSSDDARAFAAISMAWVRIAALPGEEE